MTTPDGGGDLTVVALARQLATVRETVATLATRLAGQRGQIAALTRRIDGAGLDDLADRVDALAATVAAALDAAAPRGPAAPRWDQAVDADVRARQLGELRAWVDGILLPVYCWPNGPYEPLRPCWAEHPAALVELSNAAAQYRWIYAPDRPSLSLSLEYHDRWLGGIMRRVSDTCQPCVTGHLSASSAWRG